MNALVESATTVLIFTFLVLEVSIHALVQSATQATPDLQQKGIVSIHALVQSATYSKPVKGFGYASFNPRTRTECDNGAVLFLYLKWSFNPRTRTECDQQAQRHIAKWHVSIHALVQSATSMQLTMS